jgi:hypothetical protein
MQPRNRQNAGNEWNYPAIIHDSERNLLRPCILSFFSDVGAQITGVLPSTLPNEFILQISHADSRGTRVIWRTNESVGVEFIRVATSDAVA